MSFLETLGRARAAVEQQGRLSVRALGRELGIAGDELDAVVEELVDVQRVARREERVLVWTGADGSAPAGSAAGPPPAPEADRAPRDYTPRHLAERILQSRSALEGERKQVTVLFADVKGSMDLAEQLDPEQWHKILDRFLQILTEGVHRFEGTVNQYTGDGVMALFGAPIAHEDHAQRACFAALHLRDTVRGYAAEVRERHGVPFGVRIGLNSGTVVVGRIGDDLRMDYTAQGHVVGLAQRMEALAESGHICLAENTRLLVEGYFQLQDLGRTRVKGVAEPVRLFDLEGVGPFRTRLDRARARGLSTFVGRDAEMGLLDAALGQALSGNGRIVGVVAEAGVGKSRLCYEFLQSCRAKGIAVYEGHCPAHGKTIPHLPVLELLRSYFGVSDGDDPRMVREKIAGRLLLLDHAFEPLLPLVWEFLRVPDPSRPVTEPDQAARQRQLSAFVRRLVRARSEQEPAVILLDDLHWIDPASDELLAEVADAVRGTRTLLLGNFRPEYQAPWMQRADYQQLPLTPLGSEAIGQLLLQLLGPDPSVADLPAAIAIRTQGNPFFTEEVVAGLIESGQLEGSAGAYRLVRPIERLEIPATVHGVLAARIDRLTERDKDVLTTAAIIGRNFDAPLLSRLTERTDDEQDAALRALCDLDLLVERALYPVAEYAFKHPLTHEVAYGSQLQERRRSLHAALAQALEEADETPALLAHHWDEAGEPEPAVHWHAKAAEEAGLLRTEDAVHHWERICQLLDVLPETPEHLALAARAHAQVLWAEARRGTTTERAREIYERANDLAERAGDPASLARSRASYAVLLLYTGQPGGLELAREAFEVAERSGNVPVRILARWACGAAAYLAHSIADAIGHCDAGIELCGDDLDRGMEILGFSPWIFFRAIRGTALAITGRLADGCDDHAVAFADHGDRYRVTQAICGAFRPRLERVHGDHVAGLAAARRGAEFLENLGAAPGTMIWAYDGLGRALAMNEDWEGARGAFEHALEMQQEHNTFRHMAPECLAGLAAIAVENGDLERARGDLARAMELAERQDLRAPRVNIHLVGARLARLAGEPANDIEDALAAATAAIHETGALGLLAEIHRERALLLAREGDSDGRRSELERARELYETMGAGPNADRMARMLAG